MGMYACCGGSRVGGSRHINRLTQRGLLRVEPGGQHVLVSSVHVRGAPVVHALSLLSDIPLYECHLLSSSHLFLGIGWFQFGTLMKSCCKQPWTIVVWKFVFSPLR